MRKNLSYILLFALIAIMSSCKVDLKPYNDPTSRVAFIYATFRADTLVNYSFAYYPENITDGTVELEVRTMGFMSDRDRTVSIRQTNSGPDAAQAGVHYRMDAELTVPARATTVKVPITLLRDASLITSEYMLEVSLAANDDFQLGDPKQITKKINIGDILLKPKEWGAAADRYLGVWGREKHKLMIEAGAEYGATIDPEWLAETLPDYGLSMTWRAIFETKLVEVNAELGENGPLKEENGTIVSF